MLAWRNSVSMSEVTPSGASLTPHQMEGSYPAASQPASAATPPDAAESPRVEIAFLSSKLPEGCALAKTDYDHGKTIYHIINERGNEIVLVAERPDKRASTDGFTRRRINNMDAYIMARRDYNILLATSGGVQYTLTNAFDARDLIEIATAVL